MPETWHRIIHKRSRFGAIIDVWDYCPRCWDELDPQFKLGTEFTEILAGAPHPRAECSECEQGPADAGQVAQA